MLLSFRRSVLPAIFVLLAAGPVAARNQSGQGRVLPPTERLSPRPETPWWQNDQFQKDLGLSTDQVAKIERLWQTARPDLRQEWDELSHQEDKLSHLIQTDADETALARQIDRVETARASASKTRSLMLVRMLRVLSPDQRVKFNDLYDHWRAGLQRQQQDRQKRKRSDESRKDSTPKEPNVVEERK